MQKVGEVGVSRPALLSIKIIGLLSGYIGRVFLGCENMQAKRAEPQAQEEGESQRSQAAPSFSWELRLQQ